MTIKKQNLVHNLQSTEKFVERVMGKEIVIGGAPWESFLFLVWLTFKNCSQLKKMLSRQSYLTLQDTC